MARGQSSFAHLLVEWGILAHKQRSTSLWRQPFGEDPGGSGDFQR